MPPRTSVSKKSGENKLFEKKSACKRFNLPVPQDYVSPLKRRREARREAVSLKAERKIATAQELRAYAKQTKDRNEVVLIYGRFLWDSYHTTTQGRHIVRLHLYDAVTDDAVEDLLENYKYDGDHCFDSDKELMTATLWDEVKGCNGVPTPGDIVCISRFTGLDVFRGEACQFNTKLSGIKVEDFGQKEGSDKEKGRAHDGQD
ncbi:hypothetical protein F444_15315 [Phytophthora nicotianae P1976]|uniref:Uncharacterized protein n=1 Tax=Phytophthora nicotianae P1976 TaxID=1317066 RepID=A0A080ZMC6_PHYNI|nr:hypothetical protein F444_15315 [Phytophthora nicotianae P1976]